MLRVRSSKWQREAWETKLVFHVHTAYNAPSCLPIPAGWLLFPSSTWGPARAPEAHGIAPQPGLSARGSDPARLHGPLPSLRHRPQRARNKRRGGFTFAACSAASRHGKQSGRSGAAWVTTSVGGVAGPGWRPRFLTQDVPALASSRWDTEAATCVPRGPP